MHYTEAILRIYDLLSLLIFAIGIFFILIAPLILKESKIIGYAFIGLGIIIVITGITIRL
ncbi:hypothetical protein K8O68_05295 [Salipaludibacillus sp. CUR1]|uniref:hypothetical protein n=1 Tax=Salipaludibacillus sp. CUR1 TaxID=2820003 RepID=UPI001E633D81|nr:hypothetical protein [Salipaludibacillus sp. CUR1]MCE7791833.1 hypothetical protein [Salipaludibacillus sp. CUR1]